MAYDKPPVRQPIGYQQITSLGSATALTVPAGARIALIQAESQNVRWRDDATNPTTTVGMRLTANSDTLYVGNLGVVRFIEETASAKLNVTYYN